MTKVLIATTNPLKIKEFKKLLPNFHLMFLNDFKEVPEPEENGTTFEENAKQKSEYYSLIFKDIYVMSEDSGIEIEELKGYPGVYSKRWMDGTYFQKIEKLLEMAQTKKAKARYKCAISISINGKEIENKSGTCNGHLISPKEIKNAFGYDLGFVPYGYDKRMAELGQEIKSKISHRKECIKLLNFINKSI